MKVFAVLAATVTFAAAAPGGYTLNGGVYHNKERNLGLDYMDAAKSAGKSVEKYFGSRSCIFEKIVSNNCGQKRSDCHLHL